MNNPELSRAWAVIHTDKLKQNIKNIKNHIGNGKKLMAVIKADAYGHGFREVAKIAVENGADYLAVACIEEAKQIRKTGISHPILVLGATPLECVGDLFEYNIIPTVFEEELPKAISEYAKKANKSLKIHIKVDTGMGRIGFQYYGEEDEKSIEKILEISRYQGIETEGIYTHFACADEEDGKDFTKKQFSKLMYVINELESKGVKIPVKHCANSAAICCYKEMHLDMVRAGIILYGEYPSRFIKENTDLKIEPVMELKSMVSQVKTVKKGTGISYGHKYKAKKDNEKLAVVCVGYADSYYRSLSGKTKVIINGKYAPQVGNICMDQMIVDINGIDNVHYGTEVTLVGRDKDAVITFSDLAEILGTISYEIMSDVGKRIVKGYFDKDKLVNVVNYLEKM